MSGQFSVSSTTPASALIVDKSGIIGEALAQGLGPKYAVTFVTKSKKEGPYRLIAFTHKIPRIPDLSYDSIFLHLEPESSLIDLLSEFSRKAEKEGSELIIYIHLRTLHEVEFAKIKRFAPKAKIFVYGDIGGGEAISAVNSLILGAIATGSLKLLGNGLSVLYPTPLNFLVGSLSKQQESEKGKLYFLFPRSGMTELSFARELKNVFPELRIDFIPKRQKELEIYLPADGEYVSMSSLKSWIKSLSFLRLSLPKTRKAYKIPKAESTISPFKWLWLFIFLFFFLPFSFGLSFALAGGIMVKSGVGELLGTSYAKSERDFRTAKNMFVLADIFAQPISLLESIRLPFPARVVKQAVGSGGDLSEAGALFASAGGEYLKVAKDESQNPEASIQAMSEKLKRGLAIVQRLDAEGEIPPFLKNKLHSYNSILKLLSSGVDSAPMLLGFPTDRTYLVLFQNDKELRGGGGFIGSYGLFKATKGKVSKLTLHDVYDADGQLEARIEPPYALRRFLGASNWYLRDSNYAVDFPTNAEKAAFFLEKEKGEKVDGVIAITSQLLKDILQVTGPVVLSDYNTTISAENMFGLIESKTQDGFFPGSQQKKSILSSVFVSLEQKIRHDPTLKQKLAAILPLQLERKQILFYSFDPTLNKLLQANSLSSSLPPTEGKDDVLDDFAGVNEMNLGQNKVNEYVTRSLEHSVKFDSEGSMLGATALTLNNNSTKTSPYGGIYKVYLRFIVPFSAQVLGLSFDGVDKQFVKAETSPAVYLSKSFKPGAKIEVEQSEEKGRSLYGLYLELAPGESRTITLNYTLPAVKVDKFTYRLVVFKQPGTGPNPFSLVLDYPDTLSLVSGMSGVVEQSGGVRFSPNELQDTDLRLEFAHKK